MIRTLLVGAVIGFVGKKLLDQGKLDPYVDQLKTKLEERGASLRDALTKTRTVESA